MNMRLPFFLGALILCLGSCQQQNRYPVHFLTESSSSEAGASFNILYSGHYYNRMPIMSLKHFDKFKSFLADDGSYGVVLYTQKVYRNRLFTATQENIGKRLLPVVNGLAFEPTMIDQGIQDGTLIIWGGLNGFDLKQLSRHIEPVEQEIEEKRYLDDNPRPLPKLPKEAKGTKDMNDRTIPEIFSYES